MTDYTVLLNLYVQGSCFVRVRVPAASPADALDAATRWGQMQRSQAVGAAHDRRMIGRCTRAVVELEPAGPVDVDLTTA